MLLFRDFNTASLLLNSLFLLIAIFLAIIIYFGLIIMLKALTINQLKEYLKK